MEISSLEKGGGSVDDGARGEGAKRSDKDQCPVSVGKKLLKC